MSFEPAVGHKSPGGCGEVPEVLPFDAAIHSDDLRIRTMATILDLICGLVTVDVALFYTATERLEKYATEPIIAKVKPARSVDLNEMLRQYRECFAEHDPFALSHAARSHVTVLSSQDLGGDDALCRAQPAPAAIAELSLRPVAEMYLRVGGKIPAGITFLRHPSAPDLTLSEMCVLRRLHGLCEHAYGLSTHRTEQDDADLRHTSGLTARQREVLLLAVRGASSRDIADTLHISHATVKTHLRHAYKKLGVANRHQALLLIMAGVPPPRSSPPSACP